MTISKAVRLIICRFMIGVILLTQLSIAAYACPGLTPSMGGASVIATSEMPKTMPGCDQMAAQMDKAFPNLCAEHCHQGDQSDQTHAPVLPAVALISLYTVESAHADDPTWPSLAEYLPRAAAPPPLSILHCCFRT